MTRYKFRLVGNASDFLPGEDRAYEVSRHGQYLGIVSTEWLISATPDEPVRGFSFLSDDGRYGEGRTRAAAVENALKPATKGS